MLECGAKRKKNKLKKKTKPCGEKSYSYRNRFNKILGRRNDLREH